MAHYTLYIYIMHYVIWYAVHLFIHAWDTVNGAQLIFHVVKLGFHNFLSSLSENVLLMNEYMTTR